MWEPALVAGRRGFHYRAVVFGQQPYFCYHIAIRHGYESILPGLLYHRLNAIQVTV